MDLPTYTNVWSIEKRLYKLYDLRLPMPLPLVTIGVYAGSFLPWIVLLQLLGVPFGAPWHVLYLVPPGLVAWLATRPVIEGKRLNELLQSQLGYLSEPRTWCRLTPLREPDRVVVVARVWRSPEQAAPTLERVLARRPVAAPSPAAAASPAKAAAPQPLAEYAAEHAPDYAAAHQGAVARMQAQMTAQHFAADEAVPRPAEGDAAARRRVRGGAPARAPREDARAPRQEWARPTPPPHERATEQAPTAERARVIPGQIVARDDPARALPSAATPASAVPAPRSPSPADTSSAPAQPRTPAPIQARSPQPGSPARPPAAQDAQDHATAPRGTAAHAAPEHSADLEVTWAHVEQTAQRRRRANPAETPGTPISPAAAPPSPAVGEPANPRPTPTPEARPPHTTQPPRTSQHAQTGPKPAPSGPADAVATGRGAPENAQTGPRPVPGVADAAVADRGMPGSAPRGPQPVGPGRADAGEVRVAEDAPVVSEAADAVVADRDVPEHEQTGPMRVVSEGADEAVADGGVPGSSPRGSQRVGPGRADAGEVRVAEDAPVVSEAADAVVADRDVSGSAPRGSQRVGPGRADAGEVRVPEDASVVSEGADTVVADGGVPGSARRGSRSVGADGGAGEGRPGEVAGAGAGAERAGHEAVPVVGRSGQRSGVPEAEAADGPGTDEKGQPAPAAEAGAAQGSTVRDDSAEPGEGPVERVDGSGVERTTEDRGAVPPVPVAPVTVPDIPRVPAAFGAAATQAAADESSAPRTETPATAGAQAAAELARRQEQAATSAQVTPAPGEAVGFAPGQESAAEGSAPAAARKGTAEEAFTADGDGPRDPRGAASVGERPDRGAARGAGARERAEEVPVAADGGAGAMPGENVPGEGSAPSGDGLGEAVPVEGWQVAEAAADEGAEVKRPVRRADAVANRTDHQVWPPVPAPGRAVPPAPATAPDIPMVERRSGAAPLPFAEPVPQAGGEGPGYGPARTARPGGERPVPEARRERAPEGASPAAGGAEPRPGVPRQRGDVPVAGRPGADRAVRPEAAEGPERDEAAASAWAAAYDGGRAESSAPADGPLPFADSIGGEGPVEQGAAAAQDGGEAPHEYAEQGWHAVEQGTRERGAEGHEARPADGARADGGPARPDETRTAPGDRPGSFGERVPRPRITTVEGNVGFPAGGAADRSVWPGELPEPVQGRAIKPEPPRVMPPERPAEPPREVRSSPASPVRPRPAPTQVPAPRQTDRTPAITPPEQVEEHGTGGLRRLLGRGNPVDQDYVERLQRPFQGTRRIVVLGCTGGAGQTVTGLMIGHTFAQYCGEPIVALDVNPGPGALARRTRIDTDETLTSLIAAADQIGSLGAIRRYTSRAKSGLDVIAPGKYPVTALDDRDYAEAIRTLDRFYSVTMVDAAAGAVSRVLPFADQIVLVAPASADAPRAVSMTFEWLDGHGYGDLRQRAVTVINGVSRRSQADVEQAEQVARGQCRALVRIPWDDHLSLDRAPRNELKALRPPTRRAYLALTAVVAGGFSALPERYRDRYDDPYTDPYSDKERAQ